MARVSQAFGNGGAVNAALRGGRAAVHAGQGEPAGQDATTPKPWLKHQSDVRSLIFLATYFALMAVQWRHDAALFASGPLGWLACLTLWLAQLWFAAIAVRPRRLQPLCPRFERRPETFATRCRLTCGAPN